MANHPIFASTFHGDVDAVKKLLEADATLVAVRDAKNLTPLHVAASRGQSEAAQLLLDFGADIHGPTDNGEWTPLVFASYRGHCDVAKVLIDNGAGVTADDGNPIHYSGQRKHKDICRLLVEHGAIDDLIDSDDSDILALFRAAYSYDTDTVKEILSRRPELVDSRDNNNGRTPLHEACTHGDTKTVRALLKCGADVTIRDANGQVPADRAEAHDQRAVTNLLQKHDTSA
ncbi:ankyrin repeat domain-containing protein [Crateriforma conspicua]|uniref:ankyrin repeat domain-containing protein n=1 Tax=Crateriforma conspicua TaxID=2527996 RepID=UPI0011884A50|nr:ankyrin repeat domain-containing protein [Crateriforma conspicua]QDV61145.1 Ankyrin repeats (3 copies) [Crateriforma conspicua]